MWTRYEQNSKLRPAVNNSNSACLFDQIVWYQKQNIYIDVVGKEFLVCYNLVNSVDPKSQIWSKHTAIKCMEWPTNAHFLQTVYVLCAQKTCSIQFLWRSLQIGTFPNKLLPNSWLQCPKHHNPTYSSSIRWNHRIKDANFCQQGKTPIHLR